MTALRVLERRGRLSEGVPLGPLTTYKFGGPARYLVTIGGEEDASLLAGLLRETGMPVLVLGRGSNVVISDEGFDGVVVRPGPELSSIEVGEDGSVTAGAAVPLPILARDTARAARGGLEFYTGIPGSVGGAVRMNAGCHGSETRAWLVSARIVDLREGAVREDGPTELGLSYRHSNLVDSDFVVRARYRTIARPRPEAEAMIREVTRWRRDNQPGGTLNAGSVFKNPPGDTAGRIIDSLGLKGLSVGGASVSQRHANFFEADRSASAADVHQLVFEVRRRVEDATGITLEPEIRFVGEFGS